MGIYIPTFFTVIEEMLFLEILAGIFFPEKEKVNTKLKAVGFMLAAVIFYIIAFEFGNLFSVKLIFVYVVAYAYIYAFYRSKTADAIGIITFFYSILSSVDFIGILVLLLLPQHMAGTGLYYVLPFIVKSMELCIGLLMRKVWKQKNGVQVISKEIRWLMFLSGILIVMGALMKAVLKITGSVSDDIIILIIGIVCLSNFSLIYLFVATGAELERRRLRDAAGQIRMQLEIYKNKQDLYQKQGKRIHEHRNQLLSISDMLEHNEILKALEYIRCLTGNMTKELDRICTNHPVADAILNIKKQEALEQNITVNFLCSDLSKIILPEEEIIILLGNLLDNAIEACVKCQADKCIQVSIIQEENQLVIAIKNTCAQPLQLENGRIVSTKSDEETHGYGLAAVWDITEKYDGSFVIRQAGEYMKATVVIPVP